MNEDQALNSVKRFGTGLSFIIFPVVFLFAFAVHPDLLHPRLLGPEELILRARGNSVLQFGRVLVTLNTGLLVVVAFHFMKLLEEGPYARAGFLGGILALLGALMLAADKGALCLTMSALDTVSDGQFALMMPGLLAMFTKQGWLALMWGLLFLPIGFVIQAVALLQSKALPRWQCTLFLVGVLVAGTPDGLEIINLTASFLLACACVPYGIQLLADRRWAQGGGKVKGGEKGNSPDFPGGNNGVLPRGENGVSRKIMM